VQALAVQTLAHPAGVAFGPKEYRTVIAVNADDSEALAGEKDGDL